MSSAYILPCIAISMDELTVLQGLPWNVHGRYLAADAPHPAELVSRADRNHEISACSEHGAHIAVQAAHGRVLIAVVIPPNVCLAIHQDETRAMQQHRRFGPGVRPRQTRHEHPPQQQDKGW